MSTDTELQKGDLVWAKMKGFSPWPGMVTEPRGEIGARKPKSSKPMRCVFFFGSNNYAWIEDVNVKSFHEFKDKLKSVGKGAAFKEAMNCIEDYISRKEAGENVDKLFEETVNEGREDNELQDAEEAEDEPEDELDNENDADAVSESSTSAGSRSKRRVSSSASVETEEKEEKPVVVAQPNSTAGPGRKRKIQENGEAPVKRERKPAKKSLIRDAPAVSITAKKDISRKSAADRFLDRPSVSHKPEPTPLNVGDVSQTLKDKRIIPSDLKFGFLGLGNMGSGIVKNLINSGHTVVVWNRTPDKCKDFVNAGADQGMTPSDVVASADITFSCIADANAAKEMVFGNCGVLDEMNANKGYVEMTSLDSDFSADISEAISSKGGRYLEAQIQGNKSGAEEGLLLILAAGDRSLYDDCLTAFSAMSTRSFFLGGVGNAAKMNLVLQLIQGVSLTALSEGMALADRANLQAKDVLELLSLTSFSNQMIKEKGEAILEGTFAVQQPLQYLQKDLNMALNLGNQIEQPLPVTASANEVFKHAKRLGYGEHDASAVYIRARF